MDTNLNKLEDSTYFRIGTRFWKIVYQPMAYGNKVEKLIEWSVEAIKQDHGKAFIDSVPKLDGFCLVPDHLNYRRIVDGFYNRYAPFNHEPIKGVLPVKTLVFLRHIFGEQLEFGLDYITILLICPKQQLPILCAVSAERATGKSTFINWLKAIFGDNMTINSNENFQSNFNSDWGTKLIIATEETLLNRKEDSERFKNLSTAKYSKIEAKGVDRQEVEFFGKFILCSNNEDNFIYLERDEIRFWVRKIHSLDDSDPDFLNKLIAEIPAFLGYILERPISTEKKTRMWFSPQQLATAALRKLRSANTNKLEFELANALVELMDNMDDCNDFINFCLGDAQAYAKAKGIRSPDSNSIKRILQDQWHLLPEQYTRTYTKYYFSSDGNIFHKTVRGKYYTVTKKILQTLGFLDAMDANGVTD